MDGVKAYIITIIACVLVSSLALAVAPEGGMKRHLRFLLGVIFTAVLLTPIAGGSFDKITLPEPVFSLESTTNTQNSLKKLMNEQTLELHQNKLKTAVANSAGIDESQITIVLKADGSLEQIILKQAQPYHADKASSRLGINRGLFVLENTND